jgi:hypothetical protein
MEFIYIKDKKNYLKENYPYLTVPKLTDKKHCIHCDKDILVGDFKVIIKDKIEYIVCPNTPKCNGDVTDWIDVD